MTSAIDDCLDRGGPPLPWVFGLAARLEGEDRVAMLDDAGALSRSLSTAADLFGLPAVCTSLDPAVAAEAAGCAVELGTDDTLSVTEGPVASIDDAFDLDVDGAVDRGRVPTALDATERLAATLDGTSVLGGLAGPDALAEALLADGAGAADVDDDLRYEATLTAGDVGVALANAFLDRDAEGIAVLEPDGIAHADRYRDAVVPLCNVIDHYDAAAVLVQRTVDADDVALAAEVGFDAITGRVAGDDPDAAEAAVDAAGREGIALGVGVPRDALRDGPDAVAAFRDEQPSGALLSSEWEVPAGTEPEALHRLMDSL